MKIIIVAVLLTISCTSWSQTATFPGSWTGNWKGELLWYKTGDPAPRKVNMELRIRRSDSGSSYTWHIIYGLATEDSRPYLLIPADSLKGHWIIDEGSGIRLDQYWTGNKFSGAFTVQNATIINSYWLLNDQLHIEFFNMGATPVSRTGKGTDEVPFVDSYALGSYQKAVLTRLD